MAEKLEADLVLNDQSSATSKKAADSLRAFAETLKKVEASSNKFSRTWNQAQAANITLDKRVAQNKVAQQEAATNKLSRTWAQAAAQDLKITRDRTSKQGKIWDSAHLEDMKRTRKASDADERAADKKKNAFANAFAKIGMAKAKEEKKAKELEEKQSFLGGLKESTGIGKIATGAFFGALAADAIIEGTKKAVELFTEGIAFAFESAGKKETQNLSYKLSLGEKEGKEALENAERIGKILNIGGSRVAAQQLPLYNVGLRGKALEQAYSTSADIAARQGTTNSGGIENNISLIERIFRKGGASSKLLEGLKGENLKDFYKNILPGVSRKEAEKRVKSGEGVSPQAILNELTRATNKQQGGIAGTGAKAASQLFDSRIAHLKELPEEFFEKLVSSPSFAQVSDKVEEIFKSLDPDSPNGKKILEGLELAFGKVGKAVEETFTPDNIEKFSVAIGKAVQLVGDMVSGLEKAINLLTGETLSKAFFQGDKSDQKIASLKFKEQELAKGQFTDIERAQRLKEINDIKGGLTASEKSDYNAAGAKPIRMTAPKGDVNMSVGPTSVYQSFEGTDGAGQGSEGVQQAMSSSMGTAASQALAESGLASYAQ